MHKRLQAMSQPKYQQDFLKGAIAQPDTLLLPLKWTKPRTVFVNSMSDLFHANVEAGFVDEVFEVMRGTPQHTYLILTKRPENAVSFWNWKKRFFPGWQCPPNVWMGTSAHDQNSASKRVPVLLQLDGCLRFLSYEPAIGPLHLPNLITWSKNLDEDGKGVCINTVNALSGFVLNRFFEKNQEVHRDILQRDGPRLHWVICGGESGQKAEPMHPAWARQVRDDCRKAGVPFFFKQWGAWSPITYRKENQEVYIKFNLGKNEHLFTDPLQNMVKLGKHATGQELDGEIIQQFPEVY